MADKALLVGINSYHQSPLYGCVNDVTDMADFLVKKFKFDSKGIRLLVNQRATTSAILERLKWLIDANPGDRCLFHFSGHGTQVATRDHAQEIDGLDEVICPVDFDWSDPKMIRDKQLFKLFSQIKPGVKFNWISDSCHSGDLSRGIPQPPVGGIKLSKAMPIPADVMWRNRIALQEGFILKAEKATLNVGFISGCRSNQTSADAFIGKKYNGALTYYLMRELEKNPTLPLNKLIVNVGKQLKRFKYSQVPQAEGTRANLPFLG